MKVLGVVSKENVLTPKDCDFFLSYYKKQKNIGEWNNGEWNDQSLRRSAPNLTRYFNLRDIPFYHLRMWLLWRLHLRRVKKDFPFLKFNYGQIVHWSHGSSKGFHVDVDYPPSKYIGSGIVDWTSVCYLNDDFGGGETIVSDTAFYPKKGKLVVFNSKKLMHGVGRVNGNRYTVIAWWEDTQK